MAWYYYTGSTTKPIPCGVGDSVSCQPYSYIEIVTASSAVSRLIKQKKLRRCGKPPKGAKVSYRMPETPVPEVPLAEVAPKTKFAAALIERGVTSSSTKPPVHVDLEAKEEAAKTEKKTKRSRRGAKKSDATS